MTAVHETPESAPRVSDERYSVLMAAVERNLEETAPAGAPERIALSAVHANEWSLADMRDLLAELAAARQEAQALRDALRDCGDVRDEDGNWHLDDCPLGTRDFSSETGEEHQNCSPRCLAARKALETTDAQA